MKKIADCKSNKGHYKAQACIVWCFDDRFSDALSALIESWSIDDFDLVKVAGGAKALAIPKESSERDFILSQIETSIRLHSTDTVILMTHSDCGAYGGLKSFSHDEEKERKFHEEELKRASDFLRSALPKGIKIEVVFVDFEGIFTV